MSNKQAIDQLISIWKNFVEDSSNFKFPRGLTSLRDLFIQIKDIHLWNAKDRIEETGVYKYWCESLEVQSDTEVNFEIELFFRKDLDKRNLASNTVRDNINSLGGRLISECVIEEISYHCILASLPRIYIKKLIDNYEEVLLVKVDDIMFFRPISQTVFSFLEESLDLNKKYETFNSPEIEEPIVAIFDGLPMQNHILLSNRLLIDDPDDFEPGYLVKNRQHGTEMASLVIYGDWNEKKLPLDRKIYIRPIFKPKNSLNNDEESVPDNVILVDLIHRAVKRLFEQNGNEIAIAPTIKLINLSLGDPYRQFTNMMSPLARLLDWLSFRFKVLFIISSGNHNIKGIDPGISFKDFKSLNYSEREKLILNMIKNDSRNMRLLSPAESINNLTIGALFSDDSELEENERSLMLCEGVLPSPISAIGLGHNRAIKPDLFYNGGRKYLLEGHNNKPLIWANNLNPPGCCVAIPGENEGISKIGYTFGTSNAAAQITHEGARCFNILNEVFLNQTNNILPSDYAALLIKAMLVHSASWNKCVDIIRNAFESSDTSRKLYYWLGNGIPELSRIEECSENRITLIGYGEINKDKAHIYELPLPFDFSSRRFIRNIIVTLAYFSPIESSKQKYRTAALWFELENSMPTPERISDYNAVKRSTIQHEIFYGNKAIGWDIEDSVKIRINCKEYAGSLSSPIPYTLFVTFEAEGIGIDIYNEVLTKIREKVPITPKII